MMSELLDALEKVLSLHDKGLMSDYKCWFQLTNINMLIDIELWKLFNTEDTV